MGVNVLNISESATTPEVLPRKGARDLRFLVLATMPLMSAASILVY